MQPCVTSMATCRLATLMGATRRCSVSREDSAGAWTPKGERSRAQSDEDSPLPAVCVRFGKGKMSTSLGVFRKKPEGPVHFSVLTDSRADKMRSKTLSGVKSHILINC